MATGMPGTGIPVTGASIPDPRLSSKTSLAGMSGDFILCRVRMIGFLRPMETEFFHETRFWDNWKPADYRAMVAARDLL